VSTNHQISGMSSGMQHSTDVSLTITVSKHDIHHGKISKSREICFHR